MRIIAGNYRGRTLEPLDDAPADKPGKPIKRIRPTSDKVRGAIFNILQHGAYAIDEHTRVLDGFCGSGALGLEALSRGASFALFLDNNLKSLQLAKNNAGNLNAQKQCSFEMRDLAQQHTWRLDPFNLIFLDPPYRKTLVDAALVTLTQGGFVANGALAIAETADGEAIALPQGWQAIDQRRWGGTAAHFLTYNK